MPKIDGEFEVLAGDDAVLGDVMTVNEPKPLKGQVRRKKRKLLRMKRLPAGVATMAIAPPPPAMGAILQPAEADGESTAKLLVMPAVKDVVKGAIKGGIYGAVLGGSEASAERRIGGGAVGGAVAFPVADMLGEFVKEHLAAAHGVVNPVVDAVIDGVSHVGGAAASVAAAGGEPADGAIAGAAVVAGKYVLDWLVEK